MAGDAAWVLGTVVAGATTTPIVTKAIQSWYSDTLKKPRWTPPDKIFAPVWTLLYASIGFSGGRIARSVGAFSQPMLLAYAHFLGNLLWAPIFFGFRLLKLAAYLNIGLVLSLLTIQVLFFFIVPSSALLLLPYLLWLIFATVLNFAICRLNPSGVSTSSSV